MAEALVGTWNYDSVENLDAYMEASGVPEQMKELARTGQPKVEITKSGNIWNIKTSVGDKVLQTDYPENAEVDTVNLMGKPIKAVLKVVDTGLVETQKSGDLEITIRRNVEDGFFVARMSTKGVEAKAKFVKE